MDTLEAQILSWGYNPEDVGGSRELPDGRILLVKRLLYHWTLLVDCHATGYNRRYCYMTCEGAVNAMNKWDGKDDPEGWHRNPETGRRRNLAGDEWIEW